MEFNGHAIQATTSLIFENAMEKLKQELAKEGFRILSTNDVSATLKQKLNLDFPKYTILGACNPPVAYKAMSVEKNFGHLLTCNLVVYENDGKTIVAAGINPKIARIFAANSDLRPVTDEVNAMLMSVIQKLE